MGKQGRSKRGTAVKTNKTEGKEKARQVGKSGRVKRKRGDSRVMTKYAVASTVVKQKKGGKNVYGERKCKIHLVCDCVKRANPVRAYKMLSGE